MKHRLVASWFFVACAWLTLPAPDVGAQTPPSTDASELETEARARFQLGQLYYSQARFAEAAQEFEAAYATHPHPLLLHNIYLALRDLGDIPGAVDALRRYLASATDLSASDRRLLEGRLATMERQLGTTPTTTAEPDPVVTTTDETPVERDALATSDETTSSDETSSSSTASHESSTEPAASTDGSIGLVPGAVTLAIGGAALIGAAIAGGVAMSIASDRDAQCTLPNGDCPASVDQNDYANRFGMARDAGWGLLIVGAATAAVGAVLLGIGATQGSADQAPTVSAACDGTGCAAFVAGSF